MTKKYIKYKMNMTSSRLVQPIVLSKVRPVIMRRILSIIKIRQDGKCHFCSLLFTKEDILVSRGYRRNYYHISCAKTLHII